jgi:hypothetical protein
MVEHGAKSAVLDAAGFEQLVVHTARAAPKTCLSCIELERKMGDQAWDFPAVSLQLSERQGPASNGHSPSVSTRPQDDRGGPIGDCQLT